MASEPEWNQVPSPIFWKMCRLPLNRLVPTQLPPSPPIWQTYLASRSISVTRKWQPIPARDSDPSGTFVELLCGQPEQKCGARCGKAGLFWRDGGGTSAAARPQKSRPVQCASSRAATMGSSRSGDSSPVDGMKRPPSGPDLPVMCSGRTGPMRVASDRICSSTMPRFSSTTMISVLPRMKAAAPCSSIGQARPIL